MSIAENIKAIRTDMHFSQLDLATKLGVDPSTIAKWETGKASPRTDKLPELAKVLKCEVSDLF